MLVSVIICTYRRTDYLDELLQHLAVQTHHPLEVIVVDGGGPETCEHSRRSAEQVADQIPVRVIASVKGLTRQRNTGLRAAKGDLICLIDDDVAFGEDFITTAVELFKRPGMEDVGGISGYDMINYPQRIDTRWRLRKAFGVIPSLEPGDIDRLGSSVPVSFLEPFSGFKQVGFFYGFCMIYRASAIRGMFFDEELPTYGGEDRDFSFRVSRKWRLLLSGDLRLQHFQTPQSRDSNTQRTYQTGFGTGRTFAKHRSSVWDYLGLCWNMSCEFLIDFLAFAKKPSMERLSRPFARVAGTFAGVTSYRTPKYPTQVISGSNTL